MLLYALGRTLTFQDKDCTPAILAHIEASHYRFHALVEAIVMSDSFRHH
jgi:hypothetical protein